jgi:peroxiredoxin Q/BCP
MSGSTEGPGGAPARDGRRHPASGDPAPEFALEGTGGRTYRLSDYRGEPVVLVFYPADNSPVCTQQLRSYSEDLDRFLELGATVLCLSPQDVATHEAFAAAQGLRLPLLADTAKTVGSAYGVLGPLGFYRRSVFVVDAEGTVRFARRSLTSMTYLPAGQLIDAVRSAVVA